ncbi:hypothetical protein LCGC14_2234660, partial [marine sediment metagenome]
MALYEFYDTGHVGNGYAIGGAFWRGQTFTPSTAHTITKVALKFGNLAGSSGTMTVSIRATATGEPTGSDLASGTIEPGDITSNNWNDITLGSGVALTKDVEYAIVCRCPAGDANFNYVYWLNDSTSPTYSDGARVNSTDSGSNWTIDTGTDFMFREYSDLLIADAPPSASNVSFTKQLVAIGSNQLWYESPAGTMIQLADSIDGIDVTLGLDMFEAYGKVFIANKTNLKVVDFINVKLTITTLAGDPPDHGTVLTGGNSSAVMVVDYITALSGACTVYGKRTTTATFTSGETVTGTDDDSNGVSFAISANEVAGPHWYDWTVYG